MAVIATLVAAALALFAGPAAAGPGPNTATVPSTGQDFTIVITAPTDGTEVDLPPGTVSVQGTVAIGGVAGEAVNIVYVVDVSGSMENEGFNPFQDLNGDTVIDAADDCNGDGVEGSAMDAACFGLVALNDSLGSPANVDVGLVAFGDGSKTADMSPTEGAQPLTTPPQVDSNGNTTPDVEEVISSLDTTFGGSGEAGIGLFTADITAGFALDTDYDAALSAMNAILAGESGETSIAFFLSDGNPTTFTTGAGSPLEEAATAGTKVNTFGLGTVAPGSCDSGQPLSVIADTTGGSCTEVADPSSLGAILPGAAPALIDRVEVNGEMVDTDEGGNFSTVVTCPGTGDLTVTATAFATDADETTISADVQLTCVTPSTATPTPTPTSTATPTPTPTPQHQAAFPETGGEPSDGVPGGLPPGRAGWLAAIAAAASVGGFWIARRARRAR